MMMMMMIVRYISGTNNLVHCDTQTVANSILRLQFRFRFWWNSQRHLVDINISCHTCTGSTTHRSMACQSSVGKELDDMTECSICTEVFTDPRGLPCYHTFCLKCLLNYCRDIRPGHRMPCPLCRKEFTVPEDGLSGLQKNFYIAKLLHVRKLSASPAEREKSSDALRSLVVSDTEQVANFLSITKDVLQRLETEKNDVIKHLAGIKDEINTAADKLVAAIQRDKAKLVSEVGSIRVKRVKQLETVKQEVKQHRTALESFVRDSEMLLSTGTAYDVRRSAISLHDRADELMKFDVIGHVDSSLSPVNVTFTSSRLMDREDSNLVGTVTEQGQLSQLFQVSEMKTGLVKCVQLVGLCKKKYPLKQMSLFSV